MKILNLRQGTPEWLAARASHFCASEGAAMMGVSAYMTRTALLDLKKLGIEKQADYFLERLRAKGHEAERLGRPLAEEMLLEELHPATVADDNDYLLASCDGLTMDESTVWECKLWNADLVAAIRAKELPPERYWQAEQQLLVTGAERVIYTCTDGTPERFVWMEYRPVPGRAEALMAGWRQFEADLAAYTPRAIAPPVTAARVETLPAIVVQARGELIESNLGIYRERAIAWIESLNTELTTDQHFADAEVAIKFCDASEKKLGDVAQSIIDQTATVAEALATIAEVKAAFRAKRLVVSKLVESEKKQIRATIVSEAGAAWTAHIAALESRLGQRLTLPAPAFGEVMKGLKSLASIHNAVDTELARAKIAASAAADAVDLNLRALDEIATPEEALLLFRDLPALTTKAPDDFRAVATLRVDQHRAAEKAREDAQRERIREEERAALVKPIVVAVQADPPEPQRVFERVASTNEQQAAAQSRPPQVTQGFPPSLRGWAALRGGHVQTSEMFDVTDPDVIPREFFALDEARVLIALAEGRDVPGIRPRVAA